MTDPRSPYRSSAQMMSVPCVVFNARTRKWVLWFQHVLRYTEATTGPNTEP